MISNIQVLRAFAAIVVVLYHAVGLVTSYGFSYSGYENLTLGVGYWGAFGVDIFFIISGFIMFMIQDKKNKSATDFAMDRLKRIVPIYWFYTLIIALTVFVAPSIFRSLHVTPDYLFSSLFFFSKYLNYEYPIIYVGWSLELEMLFYVIFSILLILKNINLKFHLTLMTLIFVILVFTAHLNTIIFEFLFGGLLYFVLSKYKIKKSNYFWIPAIISMLFVGFVHKGDESIRFISWGIPALILFFSILNVKEINNKILIKLGDASYSIYLVQVFTQPLMGKILVKVVPDMNGFIVYLIMSIFTLIVGYISYAIIEKRFISILSGSYKIKKTPTLVQ